MWHALVLGMLLTGQADSTNTAKDEAAAARQKLVRQVQKLIRVDMRSFNVAEREAAEQELVKLGPDVLDLLPEITDDTPAEIKQRLGRVRDKLQTQASEAAGKAAVVTLKGKMRLSDILAAIGQQTDNKVIDYRDNFNQQSSNPEIEVALDKVPFWQALDTVLDKANLMVYAYPEGDQVAVVNREGDVVPNADRPIGYAGPFRFEATRITAQRSFRNPAMGQLLLDMDISWEPRLRPINLQLSLGDVKATDENGGQVAAAGAGARSADVTPGTFSTEMVVPLALPGRGVKRIASFKTKLLALAPGKVDTFRFDKLDTARRPEIRKAGVTVRLDQVRKNNDTWEFRVVVRYDQASGALASHRNWIFNNETYLEDKDGKPVSYNLSETFRHTDDEYGVAYYYDLENGPAGYSLVYKTPSLIMSLPVELEIKNLELP